MLDGEEEAGAFVSTGRLPEAARVRALLEEAHARFLPRGEGAVSTVYPALARQSPDLFGLCVVGANGAVHEAGDADRRFVIMSVSKPFVFALVCAELGAAAVRARVGVNATGLAFNAAEGIERMPGGRTNPMVNAGAIATTGLASGATEGARWRFLHEGLSRFAGRKLPMNREVLASARETNHRNRGLAHILHALGALEGDPEEAVDLYTRQCALDVTARDLAAMGATLADGGVNPLTGERVVPAEVCHDTLAVMATAGLYETSGEWLCEVGLPGKSGIGGGIVAVSPGKGGLGVFSPPLDAAGNSVRGGFAARFLSQRAGLDLFVSAPAVPERRAAKG